MKRKRRPVQPGEFHDPDENYDTPPYSDGLEESLAEDTMTVMKIAPFKAVKPTATVEDVMQMMIKSDIACVMVLDRDKLLGIVSERDILTRVADGFAKVRKKPIVDIMTPDPVTVHDTDAPATALNLMAVGGFRHIPILDVDDHVVGMVGPRRIIAYLEPHLQQRR